MQTNEDIRFTRRAQLIFAGAFFGLLLSKGLALIPGYGLDDYSVVNLDRSPLQTIGQGRYTHAAIQYILTNLDISATAIAWPIIILFFIVASIAITTGILFATRRQGPVIIQTAIAALVGAHPYLTEYFSFRESLTFQATSFALLAYVFVQILKIEMPEEKPVNICNTAWLIIPLVAIAGAQQTIFLIVFFLFFTRFVIDLLDDGDFFDLKLSLKKNIPLAITLVISAIIYVIVYIIIRKIFGVAMNSRATLISFSEVYLRLGDVAELVVKVLFTKEPMLSMALKTLLLLTTLGFIIKIGISSTRRAFACLILFVSLVAGSIFLVSISSVWWPVPRAIYGIGFSFGLTMLAISVWLKSGQKFFLGMIIASALGLSFHSNAVLHDQQRLNRWDFWTAGALAQDIWKLNLGADKKIILVGAGWVYPAGPKTIDGDLNVSALSVTWAAKYLMKEATGRDWNIETAVSNHDICTQNIYWPSPESIHVQSQEVVVCMGKR